MDFSSAFHFMILSSTPSWESPFSVWLIPTISLYFQINVFIQSLTLGLKKHQVLCRELGEVESHFAACSIKTKAFVCELHFQVHVSLIQVCRGFFFPPEQLQEKMEKHSNYRSVCDMEKGPDLSSHQCPRSACSFRLLISAIIQIALQTTILALGCGNWWRSSHEYAGLLF